MGTSDKGTTMPKKPLDQRITYIIGEKPFLYKAVSDGSMNLALYRWGKSEKPAPGEEDIEDWRPMRKYAGSLDHAMDIIFRDAQLANPRKRTAPVIEGRDDIIKHLNKIKRCLSKIAVKTAQETTNNTLGLKETPLKAQDDAE